MNGGDLDDPNRLGEIVRQQERYVASQLTASAELDDKIEQLLALALALTGAGLVVTRMIGVAAYPPVGAVPLMPLAALILGFGLASLSALILLDAYVGLTENRAPRVEPGTDPVWLAGVALDPTWTLAHIQHATIKGLRDRSAANQREFERIGARRRFAILLALAAVAAYLAAMFLAWWNP